MKVYITAPFRDDGNKEEIEKICSTVRNAGFDDFCFVRDVEKYQKVFDDPKELMKRNREEIQNCDALLFDASEKSTSRAIETGMAYEAGKKIVVTAKKGSEIKSVLNGVADAIIYYDKIEELEKELKELYKDWTKGI